MKNEALEPTVAWRLLGNVPPEPAVAATFLVVTFQLAQGIIYFFALRVKSFEPSCDLLDAALFLVPAGEVLGQAVITCADFDHLLLVNLGRTRRPRGGGRVRNVASLRESGYSHTAAFAQAWRVGG